VPWPFSNLGINSWIKLFLVPKCGMACNNALISFQLMGHIIDIRSWTRESTVSVAYRQTVDVTQTSQDGEDDKYSETRHSRYRDISVLNPSLDPNNHRHRMWRPIKFQWTFTDRLHNTSRTVSSWTVSSRTVSFWTKNFICIYFLNSASTL
jgi:hypothetical protein